MYTKIFFTALIHQEVQRRYFNEEYDPADFFYSADKTLSANDVKSSSLVNNFVISHMFSVVVL